MKNKVISDINDAYLKTLNDQPSKYKSIFEINGKKYAKT